MVAALAMLVAVPSAYAATVNVDASCQDDDDDGRCNDGTTFKNPRTAFTAANRGDVIVIADGRYLDSVNDYIVLNKPITLKSTNGDHAQDDVIFNGTGIRINADNVKVQGIEIVDARSHGIFVDPARSDIVVENNYVNNTHRQGITGVGSSGNPLSVDIIGNTFEHIGYNAPDGKKPLFANGDKASQHDMTAIYFNWLANSEISGNTIDKTTWSGINLGRVTGLTISGNTISDVPKNGIQIAKIDSVNNTISGNTITNATFADSKHRGGALIADNLKGAISLSSSLDTLVENNVIRDSRNGVILCDGDCHATTFEPDTSSYSGKPTANVTKNTFVDLREKHIINAVADYVLVATHNYYGTAAPDFTAILSGDIHYNPYYNDPELQVLVDKTGTVQKSTADLDVSPVCSISLGTYIIDFAGAKYGATSPIAQNQIKNAGNQDIGSIKFTSTGWLKPDKTPLSNAVSRVGTNVGDATSYAPITADPNGVNFDDTDFIGPNTLPTSGSSGSAQVGFVLDLSRVATGAETTITESVTYSASCS